MAIETGLYPSLPPVGTLSQECSYLLGYYDQSTAIGGLIVKIVLMVSLMQVIHWLLVKVGDRVYSYLLKKWPKK